MPYQTKEITLIAECGTEIKAVVPVDVPTNERAEELRAIYAKHVKHPEGHWKGRAYAIVEPEEAADVAEAMDFHGSIVDSRAPLYQSTKIVLFSQGYWAHGF